MSGPTQGVYDTTPNIFVVLNMFNFYITFVFIFDACMDKNVNGRYLLKRYFIQFRCQPVTCGGTTRVKSIRRYYRYPKVNLGSTNLFNILFESLAGSLTGGWTVCSPVLKSNCQFSELCLTKYTSLPTIPCHLTNLLVLRVIFNEKW